LKTLSDIRKEIDGLDSEIFELLIKRIDAVLSTIDKKNKIEDLAREAEILSKISGRIQNEEIERYLKTVYMSIFAEGKRIQKKLNKNKPL